MGRRAPARPRSAGRWTPWDHWPVLVRSRRQHHGLTGRFWPAGLGGHRGLTGRFWRRPRPRKSHRDASLFHVVAGRLSSHAADLLDLRQRPSQAQESQHLLFIRFAQDIHLGGDRISGASRQRPVPLAHTCRLSAVDRWPTVGGGLQLSNKLGFGPGGGADKGQLTMRRQPTC